ncbi:MAG: pyridoxal phosphate-dependent aminotransferase [Hyphomicrobiales bacterium]
MKSADLIARLTAPAQIEPDSGIVNVAMYGMARKDIIAFWSGEGNLPTPEAFCRPAVESLLKGETFYTWQRGIPELREALARYHTRHYGREFSSENFFVTGGGMQAIQNAIQMLAADGDEVLIPTPAWPNYAGPLRLQGTKPVDVPMSFANGRWALDLDRLFAARTSKTRAIALNSPSNPLGWTASRADLIAIRDFARKHGLWIIGDEVYTRFYFGADGANRAPSFLDVCDTEEQLVLCNTFSKNWAMTGWRQGWVQAPKALGPVFERFIQYNTSGSPVFLQKGCAAALDLGDSFVDQQVATARKNRDIVIAALRDEPRIRFQVPDGAFYMFFAIEGMTDSLATARQIVDEASVGFAPGAAFGEAGEGFLRMCYLKDESKLREGLARFKAWLATYKP